MNLYIVRHGESEGNASKLHQAPDVRLSVTGIQQAESVAKRFKNIDLDLLLASPFERAKRTAEIIGGEINKPIHIEPLFAELKRPSEIVGKNSEDPSIVAIRDRIRANWHDPNWRHSDEENFFELRERAIAGLKRITALKEQNVLLVSHGLFIVMLFSIMTHGNDLQPREFECLLKMMHMKNTGISLCEYNNERWKLITWNDHAHLG